MEKTEITRLIREASKDDATPQDKAAAKEAIQSASVEKSRGVESRLAGARA